MKARVCQVFFRLTVKQGIILIEIMSWQLVCNICCIFVHLAIIVEVDTSK